MITARLSLVDALRTELARDAPLHRPDEVLPPAGCASDFLACGLDGEPFGLALLPPFLAGARWALGDIDALYVPCARGDFQAEFDCAAVSEHRPQEGMVAGIAVKGCEEAAVFIKHQFLLAKPGRNRTLRRCANDPPPLRQPAFVSECRENLRVSHRRRIGGGFGPRGTLLWRYWHGFTLRGTCRQREQRCRNQ